MFSFVSDTVLDPFAGTGSTAVAAIELQRNSIMIDVEKTYIELMRERLLRTTRQGVDIRFLDDELIRRRQARRGA